MVTRTRIKKSEMDAVIRWQLYATVETSFQVLLRGAYKTTVLCRNNSGQQIDQVTLWIRVNGGK